MQFITRAVVGGVLVLVPVLAVLYILNTLLGAVKKAVDPIALAFPGTFFEHFIVREFLAVFAVLLICFALGVIVQTGAGHTFGRLVEDALLAKLPGYTFFKRVTGTVSGADSTFGRPVLVRFDDNAQFGFLIDEGKEATVFLPSPPGVAAGSIVVVALERVQRLDVKPTVFIQSLSRWGFESQRFIRS